MEVERTVKQKVVAAAIRCVLPVRYDEDDMPNDAPFRKGEMWDVTIDINTGKIRGWPKGKTLNFSMKVCDMGRYYLLGIDGEELAAIEDDYVPDCIPQSYGDYVDFNIDHSGIIEDWSSKCREDSVQEAFFGDDD